MIQYIPGKQKPTTEQDFAAQIAEAEEKTKQLQHELQTMRQKALDEEKNRLADEVEKRRLKAAANKPVVPEKPVVPVKVNNSNRKR